MQFTYSFPETFFLKIDEDVDDAELDDDDDEIEEREADSKLESFEVIEGVGDAEISFRREGSVDRES